MNALAIRATIPQLVANLEAAMAQYGVAYDALSDANALASLAAPSTFKNSGIQQDSEALIRDRNTRAVSRRAEYLADRRKDLDKALWGHVIDATNLERLMDAKAREQFRRDLADNPPPATVENIMATMEQFLSEADTIFLRGIANAFSGLSRRFRSHDCHKFGDRICKDYAFDRFGYANTYTEDLIRDVERVFYVLDGKPNPERSAGIVGVMRTHLYQGSRSFPFVVEDEYFKVRGFKKGSLHLWFKRRDLVEKVNQLLASYYGEVLGDAHTPAEHGTDDGAPLPRPPMPANFGLYETLGRVRETVLERAYLRGGERVLEPSAGRGALARPLADKGASVTCVEFQPELAADLKAAGVYERVVGGDFLDLTPADLGTFDLCVANPPFGRGLDVDHVTHMLQFIRPGGRLVAVMAAGVEFREDRRHRRFRALIERITRKPFTQSVSDLPPGSFAEVGTNHNTLLLVLVTPGEPK